jgi:hypothetical protein
MNAINWFEIPAANFERAVRFYEQILAAPLPIDASFPGMRMAMLPYEEPGVGGCLLEFEQARPHADGVRVYLNGGDNLQPILDRIVAAGGQIIMPKTLIRDDIGYIGMFTDSEGNIIGLHSMH